MIVADVVVLGAWEKYVLELEPRPGWKPWRREELECQERRHSSMLLDGSLTGSVKMQSAHLRQATELKFLGRFVQSDGPQSDDTVRMEQQ